MAGRVGMKNLTYRRHSDYLIPNLTLSAEESREIGLYGRRRLAYLKQHRPIAYTNLLTTGKLHAHLADLNEQANNRLWLIIEQMKTKQSITEELKENDQMAWVGAVNNIKACAEEIINNELIYV